MTPAEKLVALSPLSTGTPAEHLFAIVAGTGAAANEILGYVLSKDVSGYITNPENITGMLYDNLATGDVDKPEKITGTINKKIIR